MLEFLFFNLQYFFSNKWEKKIFCPLSAFISTNWQLEIKSYGSKGLNLHVQHVYVVIWLCQMVFLCFRIWFIECFVSCVFPFIPLGHYSLSCARSACHTHSHLFTVSNQLRCLHSLISLGLFTQSVSTHSVVGFILQSSRPVCLLGPNLPPRRQLYTLKSFIFFTFKSLPMVTVHSTVFQERQKTCRTVGFQDWSTGNLRPFLEVPQQILRGDGSENVIGNVENWKD